MPGKAIGIAALAPVHALAIGFAEREQGATREENGQDEHPHARQTPGIGA
jgi:hypothetical protein